MTKKQILLSVFMLGTMSTIGLAMEEKIIPTEECAILIDIITPEGEEQHVRAKVFNNGVNTQLDELNQKNPIYNSLYYAIFKRNRWGANQKINIIKNDNGTYIFQGTIRELNYLYPYPEEHSIITTADLKELYYTVNDLMDHASTNNAIFCNNVRIKKNGVIHNLESAIMTNIPDQDPRKCQDIFQLYQEWKDLRQQYYEDGIELQKKYPQ